MTDEMTDLSTAYARLLERKRALMASPHTTVEDVRAWMDEADRLDAAITERKREADAHIARLETLAEIAPAAATMPPERRSSSR